MDEAIEPGVSSQVRTCKYGHGDLIKIDRVNGRNAFLIFMYGHFNESMDGLRYVGPMQWHLCKTCGYMEVSDQTPNNTIALMD